MKSIFNWILFAISKLFGLLFRGHGCKRERRKSKDDDDQSVK